MKLLNSISVAMKFLTTLIWPSALITMTFIFKVIHFLSAIHLRQRYYFINAKIALKTTLFVGLKNPSIHGSKI